MRYRGRAEAHALIRIAVPNTNRGRDANRLRSFAPLDGRGRLSLHEQRPILSPALLSGLIEAV